MNARTTTRLSAPRALGSCVYGVALAVLGCTAGGLDPTGSDESDHTLIVAGEHAIDGPGKEAQAAPADEATSRTDYDAHLARVRAGDCFGLGARVGTRGECLAIIEHHIDRARESYYDPETKDLVAEYLYDPMSGVDGWITGHADCREGPFVQGEFILCGDCDCP